METSNEKSKHIGMSYSLKPQAQFSLSRSYIAPMLSTTIPPISPLRAPQLYYIRFDGTGVCVEECPTVTNFDHLWGCTDEFSGFTADEGYDCSDDPLECAAKADVDPTGAEDGGFGGGDGAGVCMYQVESVDCEFVACCLPSPVC